MTILRKKVTLIAFVFRKLRTPKTWFDKCLKCFRRPFEKQHGKRAQWHLKWQCLYHTYWLLQSQLTWKKSLLLTSQILGLLFNTLAADEKYLVLNGGNLTIPIQMQLSQKQNIFSQFFALFLKSRFNFEHF